ncbi:MAG: alkaline phosphatase family protein, partial [Sulfuricella sp.]
MILPDYDGGSIVNLMASIESACGGNPRYPALRAVPPAEIAGARNLILLVIDGLGYDCLAQSQAGALRNRLRAKITSVFPSTTATAITTFLTGLAPQQHGLTGWFTYFREIGSVAAVLTFQPRHGGRSYRESGIDVVTLFGHTPFFDRIAVPSYVVSP